MEVKPIKHNSKTFLKTTGPKLDESQLRDFYNIQKSTPIKELEKKTAFETFKEEHEELSPVEALKKWVKLSYKEK